MRGGNRRQEENQKERKGRERRVGKGKGYKRIGRKIGEEVNGEERMTGKEIRERR